MHRAESALALGEPHEAWGPSQVAMFVAGRPFLAGEEAAWIDETRRVLSALHVRAIEAYAAATVASAAPSSLLRFAPHGDSSSWSRTARPATAS